MIDRYIRHRSDTEAYLDLSDFQFYQMPIERVHVDFATGLLGQTGEGLIMTGIYPEGIDLSRKRKSARLDFDHMVSDSYAARKALVKPMAKAHLAV